MSEDARRELEEIKTQLNTLAYRVRELERRMAMESRSAETPQPAAPRLAPSPPVSPPVSNTLAQANEQAMGSLEQALGARSRFIWAFRSCF